MYSAARNVFHRCLQSRSSIATCLLRFKMFTVRCSTVFESTKKRVEYIRTSHFLITELRVFEKLMINSKNYLSPQSYLAARDAIKLSQALRKSAEQAAGCLWLETHSTYRACAH